jgi:hypothetical protein
MTSTTPRHAGLTDRWETFSLMEQLANVGSDVGRAIHAHASGNTTRFHNAVDRALELFDLTATDARWGGHRRREILRAREEFCRLFFGTPPLAGSAAGLQKYFYYAAVAANRRRSQQRDGHPGASDFHEPE